MEKYAVQIDPEKTEKEKVAGKDKTVTDDPNRNVPMDPEKGTEPFEKEKADGETEKGK
jgi:hypothetical protein